MRKINILRAVLGVAFAMLMTVGAFGQFPAAPYSEFNTDETNGATHVDSTDYVTLKTAGTTTMGYYAMPDQVYHPTYAATGTLTALFTWTWTLPGGVSNVTPALSPANYVELEYGAVGTYAITVNEVAPPAFGTCAGSLTYMNVSVIAPPVATITTADPAQACGNVAAAAVALTFTEAVPLYLAGYAFAIHQLVETIDAGGTTISTIVNADTLDFDTAGKLNSANGLTGAASPYGFSFNTRDLDVIAGQRTRYTYTLVGASDASGDGLISAISEKSDYLDAPTVNIYPFGAKTTYVAIVNPAPTTGPIYHIPNTFAY